jgi:DNA polymerase (family 10)
MIEMAKSISNLDISKLLRNVAVAYTLKDEKKYRFQIIAYQNASETIAHSTIELQDMYRENSLAHLPGIGPSIKTYLEELFKEGEVKHFESLLKEIPASIFPLLDVPSFGPKKAAKLVMHFNLSDSKTVLEDVEKLAHQGRIAELPGFGEKSEKDILRALTEYKAGTTKSGRMVLPYAYQLAESVVTYMKTCKEIDAINTLGSLRRMVSTIGDVDISVTTHNSEAVLDHFVKYPGTERVIERGPTTAAILVSGGKHVDLLVLPPESYGSMLQHFTGSKFHNVALREYALKSGYSLSERGIKLLKKDGEMKEFKTEESFYKFLGLDWVPPEIRENQGEIDAARKHQLPTLVELKDIKGDLHLHISYPIEQSHDMGQSSMEEHAKRAHELGYEFIGFSEHNPSVTNHTSEQIISILSRRKEYIDQNIKSKFNVRVFNLLETDILADGGLALDEKALELVDAVIVSIHSSFAMDKKKMTDRIISGLSHPKAKIFAHPTGRLINQREGYQVEWDRLFTFVKEHDKALEINSWPTRLDLPDMLVKQARDLGIKFVIDTDSHALSHMDNMFYGVAVARRGWCEKKDVLNTYTAKEFESWLKG